MRAVKKFDKKISLAIGDGANDVSMIQEAHGKRKRRKFLYVITFSSCFLNIASCFFLFFPLLLLASSCILFTSPFSSSLLDIDSSLSSLLFLVLVLYHKKKEELKGFLCITMMLMLLLLLLCLLVGVGIFGKEGRQAALASDYAIHEFKHLK